MSICSRAIHVLLIGLWLPMVAGCATTAHPSSQLAAYLLSAEGSAEWKKTEAQLAQAADAASQEYRRILTIEALQNYEASVQRYLDHGFLLYRVLDDPSLQFPKGFRSSLERRASELMDIADEYLKQGVSDVVAVDIARSVIHKYSVGRMDRAQHRAEALLLEYRFRRNY